MRRPTFRGRSTSGRSSSRSASSSSHPSRAACRTVWDAGSRSSWRRPSSTPAALVVVAASSSVEGYLVAMAVGGVGFGMYMAVDLALVVDVLTDPLNAAKDLGVLNIAGALPFALAPALAPGLLALGSRQLLRPVRGSRRMRPGRSGCGAAHPTDVVAFRGRGAAHLWLCGWSHPVRVSGPRDSGWRWLRWRR